MKPPSDEAGAASDQSQRQAHAGPADSPHLLSGHSPFVDAVNLFFFATWVAICSASPELIWQGLLTVVHHFSWTTAGSVLFVGAIVAFFVEPLTERLRFMRLDLAHRHRTTTHATLAAFSFAVLAVLVHEAITSYVSAANAHNQGRDSLASAIEEVLQWSCIPFMVTVAWLCAHKTRWLSFPALFAALLTIPLIGVIFDWDWNDIFTTTVPCACILLAGFISKQKSKEPWNLSQCVKLTTVIALIWLVSTGLLQLTLLLASKPLVIYSWSEYTIDIRFYVGWVIGLAIAPKPTVHH
ncbi:hypothetical protein [Dyella humicola]|uniref:hypothetical protein n=1 Tax=Dyella humicola TaxID=2992126 RepID=UPI0022510DFD|nr:hypothetical protein [Dyella humicola]